MRLFKQTTRKTIGSKISNTVLTAVVVAVFCATASFLYFQTASALDNRITQMRATASVFSSAVSGQMKMNNRSGALASLRAVREIPSIKVIIVKRNSGETFAIMGNAIVLSQGQSAKANNISKEKPTVFSLLRSSALPIIVPVIHGGERQGFLFLLADISDLRKQVVRGFGIAGMVLALASIFGIAVTRRMQRRITAPIRHLARVMGDVRTSQDFDKRATRESDDETGDLVDSFNDMLNQISARDSKLAEHRANLEITVEQRTEQLALAKDQAEAANMAKSDFLATMSHEIRTPMNGVMVMAELLAGGNLLPRQQRYAEVIVRSGQSLLTIINDILDLSKIEAGKLELESVPLSVSGVVDDVISLFWQRAQSKTIDIAAYVDGRVPEMVEGDPVRLNQVLSNLVNNALKFTESGYVAISAQVVDGDGPRLEFSVIDTGIGIAADKLGSVFQEFTQADQSTTRKFGGTGLGLSICKKLVTAMGGEIGVESVEGKGSRFFFAIPVEVAKPAPQVTVCAGSALSSALVVLDGFAARQSIASYLRAGGVATTAVDRVGFEDIDLKAFDAVFAVPDICERLAGSQKPVVIALSQIGDSASEELIEKGVADDLIMRPVARDEMLQMIDRLARGAPRKLEALTQANTKRADLPRFDDARILVADDNAVNREVIIEVLRQLGVSAKVAKDGREAVDMWQAGGFDLVFMDCSMPVMDGYTATKTIREAESQQGRGRTPVIALTAHIAGDSADKWKQAGMDDFVTKPFTIQTIADRMGVFLTESEKREPLVLDDAADAKNDAPVSDGPMSEVASEDGPPVLDREVINDLTASGGGSDQLVQRVFTLFEENAPGALDDIKSVLDKDDQEALADAAHALKSMCANIGAAKAADACHKVELAARLGEEIDLGSSITEISQALTETLNQINLYRAEA